MAVNTDNFGFKKPDESDFYDVQDQNGNWDIADQELEKLNSPTFEDYTEDTSVPEAVTAIEALKSKSKIGMLLSNIKAAFKGACLIGHIVNNCVTDNPNLPLSAAQGKALQDQLATLNSNLGHFQYAVIKSKQSHTFNVNATCWFVLHGNTDQNGSLFAGDVRGRLYTLCGGDSSTNVLVSYDDGKLTITNNINWAEVFIVFG